MANLNMATVRACSLSSVAPYLQSHAKPIPGSMYKQLIYLVHIHKRSSESAMYGNTYYITRVSISRVRLPILRVVSKTGKMDISLLPFAPENLVSRDGFGSPVPCQPAYLHAQTESGAYLRIPPEFCGGVHLFI